MNNKLTAAHSYYWSKCPAWVKAHTLYPVYPRDDKTRLEGIEAHKINMAMIAGKPFVAPSREMERHCRAYFEDFRDNQPVDVMYCGPEYKSYCDVTNSETICDAYAIGDTKLVVWEFKYGYRPVDVLNNPQMSLFAWSIIAPKSEDFMVEFRLHQPRRNDGGPSLSVWSTTKGGLRAYVGQLQSAADSARSENPVACSGPQCRHCPAIFACQTSRKAGFDMLEEPLQLNDFGEAALAAEYGLIQEALEYLSIRAAGIEEYVLNTGVFFPGYEIITGRGSKKIKGDISWLGNMYGVKTHKEVPLTPNQLINAGIPEDILAPLVESIPGKKKLKAVNEQTAKDMFNVHTK